EQRAADFPLNQSALLFGNSTGAVFLPLNDVSRCDGAGIEEGLFTGEIQAFFFPENKMTGLCKRIIQTLQLFLLFKLSIDKHYRTELPDHVLNSLIFTAGECSIRESQDQSHQRKNNSAHH